MNTTTIWIECPVIQVRLQTAPANAASDLELLALKAIRSGTHDIGSLAAYFGLPMKIMIDVVGDHWRAGLVTVSFGGDIEQVDISTAGRDILQEAEENGRFEPVSRTSRTEPFLLNTLTGAVVQLTRSRHHPADRRLLLPRQQSDHRPQDVKPDALAEAIAKLAARPQTDDTGTYVPDQRIVSAHLIPQVIAEAAGPPPVRFVEAHVTVAKRDGGLTVEFTDQTLLLSEQLAAAERLQRYVEEHPTSPFVQALAGQAADDLAEPPDLGTRTERLVEDCKTLFSEPFSRRQSSHDRLAHEFTSIELYLADLASREVSAELVHTASEHRTVIRQLISQARRQLVFVCPWMNYAGVSQYFGDLRDAVQRGVGVTVLWGIKRDGEDLDKGAMAVFDDLARQAKQAAKGGFVHIDRTQTSHVHAKLVLSDDRSLLVTSKNFFKDSDLFEIGVAVDAPPGQAAPTLEEVSVWAHHTTPNIAHADHLIKDPVAYDEPRGPARTLRLPRHPELPNAILDEDCDPALPNIWAREWTTAFEQLAGLIHRPNPVSYLVVDGMHTALLATALRTAARRVVISSGKLNGEVVSPDFLRQIATCLARENVEVSLHYGDKPPADVIDRLDRFAAEPHRGTFRHAHRQNHHAKILIVDDQITIGSFNFLSASYQAGRRRQKGEVSLRLFDDRLADAVHRLLRGKPYRGTTRTGGELTPTVVPDSVPRLAAQVAQSLRPVGAMQAAWIAQKVTDPEARRLVWRELDESGFAPGDLTRLDAALAGHAHGDTRHNAVRDGLIRSWRHGDFVAAEAFRLMHDTGDVGIAPLVVHAAAAIHGHWADAAQIVENAALEGNLDSGQLGLLAVVEVLASIRSTEDRPMPANDLLKPSDWPSLATWRDAITRYVERNGAVPLVNLEGVILTEPAPAHDQFAPVVQRIDRLAGWKANHLESTQTQQYLLAGPFAELRVAAVNRNGDGIADWLGHNKGDVDGGWLDDQARAATKTGTVIQWSRRRRLLLWTRDIFTAARAAIAPEPTTELTELQREDLRLIVQVSRELLQDIPDSDLMAPAKHQLRELIGPSDRNGR